MTLNGLLDVPPTSSNVIITNPVASELVYWACENLAFTSICNMMNSNAKAA